MRAREDIDQQQREYFLQQQIKTIQDELGGSGQEQEIEEMRLKAVKMHWNAEVRDTFLKELAKLERTHPQSPDFSVQLNYLQTMLNLPWGVYTTDNLNLKNAEKTLNKDHYGLEKVKERILEHENMSVCLWVVCTMKQKFAVTAKLILALCPDESSRV